MKSKKINFTQSLLIAIGFMIGSGIFFKADDILLATDGNVLIAIIGWILLGSTLIFAGISVSFLAGRSDKPGGISAYTGQGWGEKFEYFAGFFMATIYAPIMVSILSSVFITYIELFLGFEPDKTTFTYWFFVLIIIFFVIGYNIYSTKIAALISSVSTIIKIIPLIIIALIGVFFGDWNNVTNLGLAANPEAIQNSHTGFLSLLIGGMISMAFAFDGWISVGALSIDMEKPKQDLAKVFSIATLITTILYVAYFTGIGLLQDPLLTIAQGDQHVTSIVTNIFGEIGGTIMILLVSISVFGALNANVMAGMRYPYAIASSSPNFPFSKNIGKLNKNNIPAGGAKYLTIFTLITFCLLAAQGLTSESSKFLYGLNLEDLAVFFTSIFYILIFIGVIRIGREKNASKFKTFVAPIIALLGQIFVMVSFFIVNNAATLYIIISIMIIAIGYSIRQIGPQRLENKNSIKK